MVGLKGLDLPMSLTECLNTSGRCKGSGQCGDVGDFIFNRRFPDVGVIVLTQFAAGGVDNQLNLVVLNAINNVWAAFMHFANRF